MTGDRVEVTLGEHGAHIENIRKEQDRLRTTLEDLLKSQRSIISAAEAYDQKIDRIVERLDDLDHDENDGSYLVRLVRSNLDRISIWMVLALVLIQLLGKEKAAELLGQGLLG